MQGVIAVLTGIVETLSVSALVYGWSSMDYVLTKEGYFQSGCNDSSFQNETSVEVICHSQQYNLELVYTLSVFISANLFVVGGAIMDRYGTGVLRDLGVFLYMTSCFAIAFSTPETSWIIYPAMIVLAISGFFLYITNLQTANLFPSARGTIVNVLNGAMTASMFVFTLVKQAYEVDISLKAIFVFMAFLGVLWILRTKILLPKTLIPYDVPNDFQYGYKEYFSKKEKKPEQLPLLTEEDNSCDSEQEEISSGISLKSCVLSLLYILATFALAMQWLRLNFYVESLNVYLDYLIPHDNALVSYNLSAFGYVQLTAFIFAPLNGILFDSVNKHFEKKDNLTTMQKRLKTLTIVCVICITTTITYSVFTLIDVNGLQYASYVLVLMSDTFQSANFSLLLLQCFPMEHFGTLYGLSSFVTSITMTLQFPLYYIGMHYFNGNFFVSNLIVLILVIAALANPINLYRKSRNRDNSVENGN